MEAFAIWGSITGAIGAINIVKTWIIDLRAYSREAKEAADTIQKFCHQWGLFAADIEVWRKLWGINEEEAVSRQYIIALWGKTPGQSIVDYLGLIYSDIETIKEVLTKFLKEEELLDRSSWRNQNGKSIMSKAPLLGRIRSAKEEKQKKLTFQKRIEFVSSTSPELFLKISAIQKQTTDMKALAKSAFLSKYPEAMTGDSIPKNKLEDVKKVVLFQLAYETRLSSRGLFQSCYEAKTGTLSPALKSINGIRSFKLEMDLLPSGEIDMETTKTKELIVLRYEMIVAGQEKLLEVTVKGPLSPDDSPAPHTTSAENVHEVSTNSKTVYYLGEKGFLGAWIKAQTTKDGNFHIPGSKDGAASNMHSTTLFRFYVPDDTRRIIKTRSTGMDQLKPLRALLYDLNMIRRDAATSQVFPRSERIRLAFKIVECGLFLSGTSWLAELRSSCLQRSLPNIDSRRHFLLDTPAAAVDFSLDDFRRFVEHAFSIGILLTEIGTGRVVHEIPGRSKLLGQGLSLYAAGSNPPSNPGLLTGSQIHKLLVSTMGDDYASAVRACLDTRESWADIDCWKNGVRHPIDRRTESYQKVLARYYSDVYLP
ncbi:hypothetical protein B0O99DRAFT_691031 [Bisporella sp. PMI_857]|nr:hypothetical protein B0O99DRAFT_691031 [Bisporella sp. PMI_857]